ncbi:single-stranded DNA-binding protein [Weissella oryzae SG25]|uniref:Single-stranded DNA-binding protein n=1 Tax=Weissella oryzae (strain DSM 25784 / JCM 18191 / LMG 30913 / SG25) TaxID=1329250 RepID=A0A069CU59_WEIOS|nr:single-stranded DNA-binding protein [Weissella oryzae]GAK30932.1 single-stranded DNA-binding protein [Weissella oryzae SG25]
MINRVVLTGRLTRDVELRYTQSGAAVASFTLAVDRSYTNANGEREADFINAVIWRKPAENFANFFSKGSLVGIEGRLQTRSYDDQSGQRRYITEVVVDNFTFLESRADREARRGSQGTSNNFAGNNGGYNSQTDSNPFGAPASNGGNSFGGNANQQAPVNNDPFGGGQEVDISDDDLPF